MYIHIIDVYTYVYFFYISLLSCFKPLIQFFDYCTNNLKTKLAAPFYLFTRDRFVVIRAASA